MSSQPFVHLSVHTEFSLTDSIVRIKPLLQAVKAQGMPAVAITDASNMFGAVRFYRQARAAGIKPILGAELIMGSDERQGLITVYCRTEEGYKNLMRLISRGYAEAKRTEQDLPILPLDWFATPLRGLVALSGARRGLIGQALVQGEVDSAKSELDRLQQAFPDGVYLEVQRTGHPDDEPQLHAAVALSVEQNIPIIATNPVRFLSREEHEIHVVREAIAAGEQVDKLRNNVHRSATPHQYLKSPSEMAELFADLPQALSNTVALAARCSLPLEFGNNYLPSFPVPEGETEGSHLRKEAKLGLEERLDELYDRDSIEFDRIRKPYDERLEFELNVIERMGFPGYFLIVSDFIRWSKGSGIPVGPGRGSGAGSLVAYALKITDLDPLKYDLLFERFLNPERVSMPDFDIDFCMDRREEVIEYVAGKYGHNSVSQIITFGTMAARSVIRDVARVLGKPYAVADRIAKQVPGDPGTRLADALEYEPGLRELYEGDVEVREIVDIALSLEGTTRNLGKHAGGVLIAPGDLTDFTPTYSEPDGSGFVSQYDKDDVETAGLVKFDFLGLRTLTIIDWAVEAVNRRRKERGERPLNLLQIPMDDSKTFEVLARQETTAVFQLESRGMKELIKRLRPDCFEDIVALVALFRPGPLQSGMVDDFIDRKHGRAELAFPTPALHHDALVPILRPTYGVILYQEQVMQIAQALAGYSLGEADLLRRAMGKKKPEEMAEQREIFVKGAVANGLTAEHAGGIFDLMEKFAGYGFNKSHSAAYALLSYQTAYLKAHYPAEFMAAVLSSDMDKTDKVVKFIAEAQSMGLKVLPPDINRSQRGFIADENGNILYGLEAIKGVANNTLEIILQERERGGEYKSLYDLCRRANPNKTVLEGLIESGALDCFGMERSVMMAAVPQLQKVARQQRKAVASQGDLFGGLSDESVFADYPKVAAWPEKRRLMGERRTLGHFVTGHPMRQIKQELGDLLDGSFSDLIESSIDETQQEGENARPKDRRVTVAGLIMDVQTRVNKKGNMAIVTLDDSTSQLDAVVFNRTYPEVAHMLNVDQPVLIEGTLRWDTRRESYRLLVSRMEDMQLVRDRNVSRIQLSIPAETAGARINELKALLESNIDPFGKPVHIVLQRPDIDIPMQLGEKYKVRPTEVFAAAVRELFGDSALTYVYDAEAASVAPVVEDDRSLSDEEIKEGLVAALEEARAVMEGP